MSNVINFVEAKEKLQEQLVLPKEGEGEINHEINWALTEIDRIDNFISGMEEDLSHAKDAKLELLTYHAGMVMAKHIIEGNDIELFWSQEEDTETINKLEEALEQLESTTTPDVTINPTDD